MMVLFDTHCHLDDEQFDGRREAVMLAAREHGVVHVVAVGTTVSSSHRCVELSVQYEGVHAAVGIQPNYCAEAGPGALAEIERMVGEATVVAIGETGLDRYWDYTPFSLQQEFFDRHLWLAQDRDLPVIIHMRDCAEEMLESLEKARRRGPLRGVMHSFTGDAAVAARCVEFGLHISFSGIVTYKKSAELRGVAAAIPEDRLLLETDAPYLSPHPRRGQRPNEPALLRHTAECLAEVRQVTPEELASLTTANACRLFGVASA